jgi:hypothetical protein
MKVIDVLRRIFSSKAQWNPHAYTDLFSENIIERLEFEIVSFHGPNEPGLRKAIEIVRETVKEKKARAY